MSGTLIRKLSDSGRGSRSNTPHVVTIGRCFALVEGGCRCCYAKSSRSDSGRGTTIRVAARWMVLLKSMEMLKFAKDGTSQTITSAGEWDRKVNANLAIEHAGLVMDSLRSQPCCLKSSEEMLD